MRIHRAAALLVILLAAGNARAQPAWDDLVPGVWTVVSSNTIQDLDPCPTRDCSYSAVEGQSGLINDWCGGAFGAGYGELGGLFAWGGGHNGYFGSEIYAFDLASGAWVRASEPYDSGSGSAADDCGDDGVYPDGSACPTHTYDQIDYHPATNRLVIIGGTGDPVCGGCVDDRIHTFDFGAGTWALGAAKPSGALYYGGTTAYDPTRDVFWLHSGYAHSLSSWDPGTDAWTELGVPNPGTNEIDGAGVVDPVRDLYVFIDGRGTGIVYAMPLEGPFDSWIELTTTGDTEIQSNGALGFDWDPVGERLVAWNDGADVYVLEPPEGDFRTGDWVWTRRPPDASNTVVPVRNGNGTYSRFRYAATVNAFLLFGSTDGPVWAYRLSPGPGTGPNPDPDAGPGDPPENDAGAGTPDAGGGGPDGGDDGDDDDDGDGDGDDGCGCVAPGARPRGPFGAAILALAVAAGILRRTRRFAPPR